MDDILIAMMEACSWDIDGYRYAHQAQEAVNRLNYKLDIVPVLYKQKQLMTTADGVDRLIDRVCLLYDEDNKFHLPTFGYYELSKDDLLEILPRCGIILKYFAVLQIQDFDYYKGLLEYSLI